VKAAYGVCFKEKIDRILFSSKELSETPLHFISRYKGDSVGRYRRYSSNYQVMSYDPLIQSHFGKATQKVPFELVNIPKALATKTVPNKIWGACIVWIEVVTT